MTNNYHLDVVDRITEVRTTIEETYAVVKLSLGDSKDIYFFVATPEQAQKLAEAFEMVRNGTVT